MDGRGEREAGREGRGGEEEESTERQDGGRGERKKRRRKEKDVSFSESHRLNCGSLIDMRRRRRRGEKMKMNSWY